MVTPCASHPSAVRPNASPSIHDLEKYSSELVSRGGRKLKLEVDEKEEDEAEQGRNLHDSPLTIKKRRYISPKSDSNLVGDASPLGTVPPVSEVEPLNRPHTPQEQENALKEKWEKDAKIYVACKVEQCLVKEYMVQEQSKGKSPSENDKRVFLERTTSTYNRDPKEVGQILSAHPMEKEMFMLQDQQLAALQKDLEEDLKGLEADKVEPILEQQPEAMEIEVVQPPPPELEVRVASLESAVVSMFVLLEEIRARLPPTN